MGRLFVALNVDTEGPDTDPLHPEIFQDWKSLDSSLAKVFAGSFRKKHGGIKFNWFIMDWAGFRTNPVKRFFGYHKIFDHYLEKWGQKIREFGDGVYWHYHHPPASGVGNEWNPDWKQNRQYEQILCRAVIDRKFFPTVFRAGGVIVDNDVSNWAEQWIPFSFNNRAKSKEEGIFDWSRAADDWSIYHPSIGDYQRPGNMNRWIARNLDIGGKYHDVSEAEIEKAFRRAESGPDTILAYSCHDYRELKPAFERLLEAIQMIGGRFPGVEVCHANALDALKSALGLRGIGLKLDAIIGKNEVEVESNQEVFGSQPFFAVKRWDFSYRRLDLEPAGKNRWRASLNLEEVEKIGVAANTASGGNAVAVREI